MSGELVLVTGGSGYLGSHCIVSLLAHGYRVRTTVMIPTRQIPSWLQRGVGRFVTEIKTLADQLGQRKDATSDKAQRVLGWNPRAPEVTLLDTARALLATAGH